MYKRRENTCDLVLKLQSGGDFQRTKTHTKPMARRLQAVQHSYFLVLVSCVLSKFRDTCTIVNIFLLYPSLGHNISFYTIYTKINWCIAFCVDTCTVLLFSYIFSPTFDLFFHKGLLDSLHLDAHCDHRLCRPWATATYAVAVGLALPKS